jgi:hypothetical protein
MRKPRSYLVAGTSIVRKHRQIQGGCWRHGLSDSRRETIYEKMKARCQNPRDKRFARYGGRGIQICQEWRGSPAAFYKWALANGYADHLQLNRRNNDKDYGPENCNWVTVKEQQNNRSNNIWIEHGCVRKTVSGWADELGVKRSTIAARYYRGWTAGEILGFDPFPYMPGRPSKDYLRK